MPACYQSPSNRPHIGRAASKAGIRSGAKGRRIVHTSTSSGEVLPSSVTAFACIIIPLARPGLAACAIYLAILSWSDFVFARTLINDQARWTITTGLVSFIGEHGIDWPALMAAGVISMIPMAVLFLLLEPFLVSGMTAGSQR